MNILPAIQKSFKNDRVIYSSHARQEMLKEEFGRIYEEEVYESAGRGKIVESYLKDKPYPSYLVVGFTLHKRPLHSVIAYNKKDNISIVVTAYQPKPWLWSKDYERRKK